MDYEQKYKDALGWMREVYPTLTGMAKEDAEHYFPELKESEDEKILIRIYKFIEEQYPEEWVEKKTKMLAWLEKQKEQKPTAEEVLVKAGLKPYKDGNQWCILAGDNIQEGICGFGDTIDDALYEFLKEVLIIQKEQKPAECMVPPPSDPFMFNLHSAIYNFGKQIAAKCLDTDILDTELDEYVTDENVDKHIKEYISCLVMYHPLQKPAEWSEDFGEEVERVSKRYPEVSFAKLCRIAKHFAEWADKYSLAEWSEEDKENLDAAIDMAEHSYYEPLVPRDTLASFLKSLRPQKQELSKSDKKMLDDIIVFVSGYADRRVLKEWVALLKSLRPKPNQEWSEEDEKNLKCTIAFLESWHPINEQ